MQIDSRAHSEAPDYDQRHMSAWCLREDDRILDCLRRLSLPDCPVVLDLGCRTGLLLRQLTTAGIKGRYVGVDISPTMIGKFHAAAAAVSVDLAILGR